MRRPLLATAGSLVALFAMATAAVALTLVNGQRDAGSPGYGMQQMMDGPTRWGDQDRSPGQRGWMHGSAVTTEFGYITEMVAHHEEAVAAAAELQRSDRPRMRSFGRSIVTSQTAQIDQMNTWLAEWYPGRPTDVDYQPMMRDMTEFSGDRLDRVFLQDMIPHHMMAVMQSERLLVRDMADHGRVRDLAASIRDEQHAEIRWMQRRLAAWFNTGWHDGMRSGMGVGQGPG